MRKGDDRKMRYEDKWDGGGLGLVLIMGEMSKCLSDLNNVSRDEQVTDV